MYFILGMILLALSIWLLYGFLKLISFCIQYAYKKTGYAQKKKSKPKKVIGIYALARKMVNSLPWSDSWNVVLQHQDSFLWGEEPDWAWNQVASKYNYLLVSIENKDGDLYLVSGSNQVMLNYQGDGIDSIRGIIALSELFHDLYEIRYCVDSWHSSDLAFIVMPHSEWAKLDSRFSKKDVDYRLMRLPSSLDEFERLAFNDKNKRNYKNQVVS